MNILITGEVHSGKTTVCYKLLDALIAEGYSISGVLAPDSYIHDLTTGKKTEFRYKKPTDNAIKTPCCYLKLEGFELGERAIAKNADITFIDEYGTVEEKGKGFSDVTAQVLPRQNNIILIRKKCLPNFLKRFANHEFKIFELTKENRDTLHEEVLEYVRQTIR